MAWYTGSSTIGMLQAAWVCEVSHCNPCGASGPVCGPGGNTGCTASSPTGGHPYVTCLSGQDGTSADFVGGPLVFTNTWTPAVPITSPTDCAPSWIAGCQGDNTGPFVQMGVGLVAATNFTVTYNVVYNGVTVISASNSFTVPAFTSTYLNLYLPLNSDWTQINPANWQFSWYGLPSSLTSPTIVETMTVSPTTNSSSVNGIDFPVYSNQN